MAPGRERLAAAAVDDLKIDERADRRGRRRAAGAGRGGGDEGEQGAARGHGGLRETRVTTRVERLARANGVNRSGRRSRRRAVRLVRPAAAAVQKQQTVQAKAIASPSTALAPSLVVHQRSSVVAARRRGQDADLDLRPEGELEDQPRAARVHAAGEDDRPRRQRCPVGPASRARRPRSGTCGRAPTPAPARPTTEIDATPWRRK